MLESFLCALSLFKLFFCLLCYDLEHVSVEVKHRATFTPKLF